jgi:pimeloyl-ACP methyl ester carboxylesterase
MMINRFWGFSMKKTQIYILVIAATIYLLATAEGTGISGIVPPAGSAVDQPMAVSFNATPVQYTQVNGVTLGYREFGSGEPLLMITGFGDTIDDWNQTFIGILASKYHVYTYDHRGMGYSSDTNATPSIAEYADDAALLMKAIGQDSMHVYGVSMGSSISQQLVIDHPERVRKLVLDSATYSIRIPETKRLLGIIEAIDVDTTRSQGIREEAHANLAWNGTR